MSDQRERDTAHDGEAGPEASPAGAVTLADIAKATGFSLMTVSNALRGKPKVSEANRARITQVAQQMGYQTNAAASMLRVGRSGIIQLVVDDFEVPFHARIAKYLTQAAAEHGYRMVVRQSSSSAREEVRALHPGPGLVCDGVILDAPNITERQVLRHGSGKPVLVIGDCESFTTVDSMDTACAQGAQAAAEHLWQAGCRSFFVLGSSHPSGRQPANGGGNGFGPRRLAAIMRTLERHGITLPPERCVDCKRTLEGGREAACLLLDRGVSAASPNVSGVGTASLDAVLGPECGVLCMSDTIAIGALREFTAHGVRIPEDLRLMGFDGVPYTAYANPPISTVAMDVPAMARTVIDRMCTLIEANLRHERDGETMHEHIPFRVIPRESTGGNAD